MSDQDVPLREVTVRGWDDIDAAPMLTGDEKQAVAAILQDTDFDSLFLLPDFKLGEDDHDVIRANADDHVDVDLDCGRLAVGSYEDYSDAAIRVTQYHRKNDPTTTVTNPGCHIPKTTTVVIEASDSLTGIDSPQAGLDDFF